MLPYIYLSITFFFASFISIKKIYFNQVKSIGQLFFFVLFVFSAIRYDVGRDYQNYEAFFYSDNQFPFNEIGFNFFYNVLRFFNFDFQFVCIIMALFTVYYASKFIGNYSPYYFLSILIFYSIGQFYFNSFNTMRQVLVAYIFLSNLNLIYDRKFGKYFVVFLFCTFCLHTISIIFFPLYFILNRNVSRYLKLILLITPFILIKFVNFFIENTPYGIYLEFTQYNGGISVITLFLFFLSLILFVFDFFLKKRDKILITLFNVNYVSFIIFLFCILSSNSPLIMVFNRLSYFFSPILIVLFPILISRVHAAFSRGMIVCVSSIVFFLLSLVTLILNGRGNNLIPYHTILYKFFN